MVVLMALIPYAVKSKLRIASRFSPTDAALVSTIAGVSPRSHQFIRLARLVRSSERQQLECAKWGDGLTRYRI
jgi:hypothetical protein